MELQLISVVNVNTEPKNGFIPEINMWWPQTMVDKNAIAKIEATIARYPKIGFRRVCSNNL